MHSADFGWGGWASNGASAGSQGFAKAAQAIEVRLVPKGQGAPGDTANAFRAPTAIWSSCSSNIGWRTSKSSSPTPSFTLGTTGRRLALEAFSISLSGLGSGSVNYAAHVSNIGWQEAVADGATAGTTGRGLPVEAIRINLSGDLCDSYDIWYRAHISNIGWLGWTKNGASAGSSGLSSPVEAVEVLVQRKGASAPGDGTAFLEKPSIAYSAYSAGAGWGSTVSNSGVAGVTGRGCALEAFKMNYSGSVPGGLSYRAHLANLGWQDTVDGDAIAGAPGQGNDLQAIAISLTGEAAKYYDVWYRVHVEDYGWLGWAKNGAYAGTSKLGLQAEAIQVTITSRNASAPGSTQDAYFEVPPAAPYSFLGISRSRLVSWLQSHSSDYYYLGTRYSTSLSVSGCMCPKGSPRSDGYTGMNCGGFVAHAYRALGANLAPVSASNGHSPWTNPGRGEYVNAWRWYGYAIDSGAEMYTFANVSALLSSGKAQRGDIIFMYPTSPYVTDCHIGFFWGLTSNQNLFWHSDAYGNRISSIVNIDGPSRIVLIKGRAG